MTLKIMLSVGIGSPPFIGGGVVGRGFGGSGDLVLPSMMSTSCSAINHTEGSSQGQLAWPVRAP